MIYALIKRRTLSVLNIKTDLIQTLIKLVFKKTKRKHTFMCPENKSQRHLDLFIYFKSNAQLRWF